MLRTFYRLKYLNTDIVEQQIYITPSSILSIQNIVLTHLQYFQKFPFNSLLMLAPTVSAQCHSAERSTLQPPPPQLCRLRSIMLIRSTNVYVRSQLRLNQPQSAKESHMKASLLQVDRSNILSIQHNSTRQECIDYLWTRPWQIGNFSSYSTSGSTMNTTGGHGQTR